MIEVKHAARVKLPDDDGIKATILGMFAYTSRSGEVFHNYSYQEGVAFLPPCLPKLKIVASLLNEPLTDNRSAGEPLASPFTLNPEFSLRAYQEQPTEELYEYVKENKSGTLSAGCGTGKTIVMTYVAGRLGCKTLILIDQSNLANNWMVAYDIIYGKKVQQLRAKDTAFDDVCITTFQLLHRSPELLERVRKAFGCLLVDEAHVVKATTFKHVLLRLDNKYRIACSATFFSKNLPNGVLEDLLAPVCVRMVDLDALIPTVKWVNTGVIWPSEEPMDFASLTTPTLAADVKRNAVIFGILKKCLGEKRRTIVVCITIKQAEMLHGLVQKLGGRSVTYTGTTSAKRDGAIKDLFEAGLLDFVFVSKKMDKGTDYPSADCIVLCRPNNNLKDAQQLTGRVVRKVDGKPVPIVYDFVDSGYLAEIFVRNRKRFYKNLKYIQEDC